MAFDNSKESINAARRAALRGIGLGAASAVMSSVIVGGVANATRPTVTVSAPKLATAGVAGTGNFAALRAMKLSALNASQLSAIGLNRRLPGTTAISNMGLTQAGVQKLSDRARKLTKADLEALGTGDVLKPNLADLTVQDIGSIRDAFGSAYAPAALRKGAASLDVSCCCCTPCCCAAAVSEPLALAA